MKNLKCNMFLILGVGLWGGAKGILAGESSWGVNSFNAASLSAPLFHTERREGITALFNQEDLTPSVQRAIDKLLEDISPNFRNACSRLYSALNVIPKEDRLDIVVKINGLGDLDKGIMDVLKGISLIPSSKRTLEVCHNIRQLLDFPSVDSRQKILRALSEDFSEKNRLQAIESINPILMYLKDIYDCTAVLRYFAENPHGNYHDLSHNMKALFTSGMVSEFRQIINLTILLPIFSSQQLTAEFYQNIYFVVSDLEKRFRNCTIEAFQFVKPEERCDLFMQLVAYKRLHRENFAAILFSALPFSNDLPLAVFLGNLRAVLPDFKRSMDKYCHLVMDGPDRSEVERICRLILENRSNMGFDEESPLVQEALMTMTVLNDDEHHLDPYEIYKDLKALQNRSVSISKDKLPRKKIDSLVVCLNPDYFRELSHMVITFQQLPSYEKNFLIIMRSQIDGRLSPEIEKLINEITGFSYKGLITGSLGSPHLTHLLAVQGKDEDSVPLEASKFISIVSHLQTLDNQIAPHGLSIREEGFLKMLACVQACPQGKGGGINDFYNLFLPSSAKLGYTSESLAHEFLEGILRREVAKMFSGTNSFFQEVLGETFRNRLKEKNGAAIIQAVHQALYIQNLIANEVGYPHTVTFDKHTHVLSGAMVSLPRESVVYQYYRYFVPSVAIKAVVQETNRVLEKDNKVYNQLCELLEPDDFARAWGLDIKDSLYLTPYGAARLLLKIGALQDAPSKQAS